MSYRPSALRSETYATARAAALAANDGVTVSYAAPRVEATIDREALAGLDDRNQAMSRRRRWAMSARTTWAVWDLPEGSEWAPCYLCGTIINVWTADGEHVDPLAGSHDWNLIGACHDCNRKKGDTWTVHTSIRDRIYAAGAGLGYVKGGKGLKPMFGARDRRPDGSGMGAWKYGDPRPEWLAPSPWAMA